MMEHDIKTDRELTQALKLWLSQRQELIIQFNSLCHLRPFAQHNDSASLDNHILTFCQVLIDYVSMGQFEMFALIVKKVESIRGCQLPPTELLESLKQTSLIALEFSDKYASHPELNTLDEDLNYLGEQIASRFDLEDDLVSFYPFHLGSAANKKAG